METKSVNFKKIPKAILPTIISFLSNMENICIVVTVNRSFNTIITEKFTKDNSLRHCVRDMSSMIKSVERFKIITNNHCNNYEDDLKSFKENYTTFTFYRAVYFLSSVILKDLQTIDLQKNNIGFDGVVLLSPLFKKTKNLINLNLAYNNLGDEGCLFLNFSLKKNNSIVNLGMECNCITDKGLRGISETFVSHKALKTIKMALNNITLEGIKFLAEFIENYYGSFNVIDFKYNNIVLKEEENLLEYFRKNKISI
jgi:Ran GTPase-activating protein (RanGAP) involved in mRNA processing and transport